MGPALLNCRENEGERLNTCHCTRRSSFATTHAGRVYHDETLVLNLGQWSGTLHIREKDGVARRGALAVVLLVYTVTLALDGRLVRAPSAR